MFVSKWYDTADGKLYHIINVITIFRYSTTKKIVVSHHPVATEHLYSFPALIFWPKNWTRRNPLKWKNQTNQFDPNQPTSTSARLLPMTTQKDELFQQLVLGGVSVAHAEVLKLWQFQRFFPLTKLVDVDHPQLAATSTTSCLSPKFSHSTVGTSTHLKNFSNTQRRYSVLQGAGYKIE